MKVIAAMLMSCATLVFAQQPMPELIQGSAEAPSLSARDRAKRQLSLRAAAQNIVDVLQAPVDIDAERSRQLVGELGEQMQQNVSQHMTVTNSRTRCAAMLVDQRRRVVERWIDEVVSRAQAVSALPLEKEDILLYVGQDWPQTVTSNATVFAETHINALFDTARTQSVALQRDALKGRVKMPPEAELNERLDRLATSTGNPLPRLSDLESLTDWITAMAVADDRPLFEEVRSSTEAQTEGVIRDLQRQYKQQITALNDAAASRPPATIKAEHIQTFLDEATASAIQKRRVTDATLYAPFAVIHRESARMGVALEERILADAVRDFTELPIEPSWLESALRADIPAHQMPEQSFAIFAEDAAVRLLPWMSQSWVDMAGLSYDLEFRKHVEALAQNSPLLKESIAARIAKALAPMLPPLRTTITHEQLLATFGVAPDTLERLAPDAVHALWKDGHGKQVDHIDTARNVLASAGLLRDGAAEAPLLMEASDQVIATANRLVPPACAAMREQANHLATLEKEWTERLIKDVDSDRPLAEIRDDWTQELQRRWKADVEARQLAYPDLFVRTHNLLDKTVRKHFEARRAAQDAADVVTAEDVETAQPPTPEAAPVTEEPPPEEPPEETTTVSVEELLQTLDFVLYFRDTDESHSEAVLMDDEGSIRLEFEPGDVRHAVNAVSEWLIPAVEKTAQSKATQHPKPTGLMTLFRKPAPLDLKIAVLVSSEQVRHMTSILLRDRMEQFVADWNADPAHPTLELEWEDDLEVVPQP